MGQKYASEFPLPGGVEQYFDTLIKLLRRVGDKALEYEALMQFISEAYPATRGSTSVKICLNFVTRMGFWAIKDGMPGCSQAHGTGHQTPRYHWL